MPAKYLAGGFWIWELLVAAVRRQSGFEHTHVSLSFEHGSHVSQFDIYEHCLWLSPLIYRLPGKTTLHPSLNIPNATFLPSLAQ